MLGLKLLPKHLLPQPHRIHCQLSLQVAEIAKDTVTIRYLDYDRDRFDIEFGCVICLYRTFSTSSRTWQYAS